MSLSAGWQSGPIAAEDKDREPFEDLWRREQVWDWQTECADQPCGTLSWDPNEMQTDDCYSATEYQGSTKYAGTCADWQASGSPTDPNAPSSSGSSGSSGSGGGGSATSCNSAQWQSQLSAACQSCDCSSAARRRRPATRVPSAMLSSHATWHARRPIRAATAPTRGSARASTGARTCTRQRQAR